MKRSISYITAIVAATASSSLAFAPSHQTHHQQTFNIPSTHLSAALISEETSNANAPRPNKKKAPKHSNGIFSPAVLAAKMLLGEKTVNKVRADVISKHSDVIASFVSTAETDFGMAVLRAMFEKADISSNGMVEEEELALALSSLGFDWLKEKQTKGIFARSDIDENGGISLDEWYEAAPKTLRTNLIKLAKKNGGEMGLLA